LLCELSAASGIDAIKLCHVLRLLVMRHCFKEVKPDVFAHNRLSICLISSNPISETIGLVTDDMLKGGAYLSDNLSDPKVTSSASLAESAFFQAHGCTIFDVVSGSKGPMRAKRFSNAMIGASEIVGKSQHVRAFPWNTLPAGSTVVDYGGGNGHATLTLLRAYPHLKIVVQDLPPVLNEAHELWEKEWPEAVKENTVQFVPFDFVKDAPVPGCSVYYLRQIIHNWADDYCVKMLTGIRKVMAPDGRIFIQDYVLQNAVRGSLSTVEEAPEPLLPNYGGGRIGMYYMDLNMMQSCNAPERTIDEFLALGKLAGLKFVKLWDAGEHNMIEFSLP